jgi:hypothetical protein
MALIELTYLTRDEDNGKSFYCRHDWIIGAKSFEIKSDDIHLIGITKMIPGTCLFLQNGQQQFVQEEKTVVRQKIREAIKEENTQYHVHEKEPLYSSNPENN